LKRPPTKSFTSSLPKNFWRHGRERSGYEYHNYPTERARRLFYYVRAIGEASRVGEFRHQHHDEKGFLVHFVLRGELWHQVKGKTFMWPTPTSAACWI
jgi:hypothetical protein